MIVYRKPVALASWRLDVQSFKTYKIVSRFVYTESSVISYLVSHPSRDVIVADRQALTLEWWKDAITLSGQCQPYRRLH